MYVLAKVSNISYDAKFLSYKAGLPRIELEKVSGLFLILIKTDSKINKQILEIM